MHLFLVMVLLILYRYVCSKKFSTYLETFAPSKVKEIIYHAIFVDNDFQLDLAT